MCSFAKSLHYLGGGAFGTVFRVNERNNEQSKWTVKVSKIKLENEQATIQSTSAGAV